MAMIYPPIIVAPAAFGGRDGDDCRHHVALRRAWCAQ
jgi:hypothetical protein